MSIQESGEAIAIGERLEYGTMGCFLIGSAFFAINPKSGIDRVSPCTTARKRLYSVAGERDIIHKISEREFPLHGPVFA
jgi:hypothetical protein